MACCNNNNTSLCTSCENGCSSCNSCFGNNDLWLWIIVIAVIIILFAIG